MDGENRQLALIESESDEALFLESPELRKKFTGATVDKMELKRNYIIDLLAAGMPVSNIAARVGCADNIVQRIGMKYAVTIANNIPQFAGYLRGLAAKAAVVAEGKLQGAKLGELAVFIGITTQRAGEMELAHAGVNEENVLEAEQVSPALASAREFLNKVKPPKLIENNEDAKTQS